MKIDNWKIFAARMSEIVGAVLLALAFFLLFLVILKWMFPSGTPLTELMRSGVPSQSRSGKLLSDSASSTPFAAVLSQYLNTVKSKNSDDIAWGPARQGMQLHDRDAVQTLKQSSAMIAFDSMNSLEIGSNSLLIIKSMEKDSERNEKKSVLLVVDGELHGKVSGAGNDAMKIELALPGGNVRVDSAKGSTSKNDFLVRVNPDKSSTVMVRQGLATVVAHGKTVQVGANHSTTFSPSQAPSDPSLLPAVPLLLTPLPAARFAYRDLPPKIRFSWKSPDGVDGFRFVLARDAKFSQVITDEKVNETTFSHGNLKPGDYYWKVSSMSGWNEGEPSPPQQIRLVQDQDPPLLNVGFPPAVLESGQYQLTGTTEKVATVYVNNKPVKTGEQGEFAIMLQMQRGLNVITVEAVDEAGNITYRTHKVTCKF